MRETRKFSAIVAGLRSECGLNSAPQEYGLWFILLKNYEYEVGY